MDGFWKVAAIVIGAGLCSPIGGFVATRFSPSSLLLSITVGFAGGILIGTASFEMIPTALERIAVWLVVPAVILGMLLTYGLDMFVNKGQLAGDEADQKPKVESFHRRHRPRGTMVTVLAMATATEELIEGLSIGVGGSLGGATALVVGIAIAIDNLSEAMSIGALARKEDDRTHVRRTLVWTGLIGLSLMVAGLGGWALLRNVPVEVLSFLLSAGAGAMLYLTTTDLLPSAEEHQYQQSAAIAITCGFLTALVLSQVS
ncbi:ZIP family metal transporter [Devosia albogilva]|uniref:ZIP family metal transporter n=1 Tax=Devosia albogilva TaxID=429726 RepID=A0ABW5QLR9_9HYPH